MKGRPPKPTQLKKLAGNPGKRKLNENEPTFSQISDIETPDWLDKNAKKMWETVMPELLSAKILTVADVHNVEAFCMSYSMWREAEEHVRLNGIVLTSETGAVSKNPAVTVINEAKKQMTTFGSLLGLDPSSRSRLTGANKPKDNTNPFSEL